MKALYLILSLFRAEAAEYGIVLPDSITIEYATLGADTLGVSTFAGNAWTVQISDSVDPDILETVVYHELGHVCGLDHCKGLHIMNAHYFVPITGRMKIALFKSILHEQQKQHIASR